MQRSAFIFPIRCATCRVMRWLSALLMVLAGSSIAGAHPPGHGEDQGHSHAHGHTHLEVDYSFDAELTRHAPPRPAGDGKYWWKGNLHTHTLWSDGNHFPEVVIEWYVKHGYHFLALSDHNEFQQGERWINPETNRFAQRGGGMTVYETYRERFGEWVQSRENDEGELEVRLMPLSEFRHLFERPGDFLLIPAEELTDGLIHVNATNIVEPMGPQGGETAKEKIRNNIQAVLDQREATGQHMIPHLNHPNFRWAVTAEDMAPVEELQFFEVYNGHRWTENFGSELHPSLDRMWDIVLTKRLAELDLGVVYGLAVDDAHDYEQAERQTARPGRGWTMIRARYLSPEHLLRAMERGEFYSTTGVELERIERDSAGMKIEIRADQDVQYTVEFIGTRQDYDAHREPVVDDKGEQRDDITMQYSGDVGETLATVQGTTARYEFEGDELYVRARIVSSREKENYFVEGEREKAWVQPVVPGEAD